MGRIRARVKDVRNKEDGVAAVEFALVLPVLMLVLVGILQFGLLFYNYIDLTSATRDGARAAEVALSQACVPAPCAQGAVPTFLQDKTYTENAIKASTSVVDDSKTTVTYNPNAAFSNAQGAPAQSISVSYPYSLNIMGVTLWAGPMKATAVAKVE